MHKFTEIVDIWGGLNSEQVFLRALGASLKVVREKRGVDQETAAAFLGITQSAYSKLESGRINVSAYQLTRLCLAFNVKASDLIPLI